MITTIIAKYNYWIYITLMMIGLYAIITKNNLVKKIIGMNHDSYHRTCPWPQSRGGLPRNPCRPVY